jgi:hypothetical protein
MGGGDELEKALLAERRQRLAIIREHGLERLPCFPLRMLRRECLHPIHRKDDLEVHGLLRPQRAVVVEGGDALVNRDEVGAARRRHARNEVGDRLLDRAVIPGGQGIGGLRCGAAADEGSGQCRHEAAPAEMCEDVGQRTSPSWAVRTAYSVRLLEKCGGTRRRR